MNATKRLLSFALAATLFASSACRNSDSNSSGLLQGPMVQLVTPTSFTVVWYEKTNKVVVAAATGDDGDVHPCKILESEPDGRHVIRFDNLEPNTKYTYRLYTGDDAPFHARTAPSPSSASSRVATTQPTNDDSFTILAFGDSGSGERVQYDLAKQMAKHEPALIVHTGDLIYPDGEREDYKPKFYDPYAALLKSVPFYPCPGNHDVRTQGAAPMFAEFVLPENGPPGETPERNYWFDYGMVRFVAMDTNESRDELEKVIAPWLDKVLSDDGPRWKVCFFHHPVYSNSEYESTLKLWNSIVPVMERRGVQLVLSGHNHLYERSNPIRNQKIVAPGEGIIYITTGAGGAELYPADAEKVPEIATVFEGKHCFTLIDVSPDVLRLTQIDINGTVVDDFEIPHAATLEPARSTEN